MCRAAASLGTSEPSGPDAGQGKSGKQNGPMSDNFETAYKRARQKIGEEAWSLLSDREQEEAVTEELRALEAERSGKPADDPKDPSDA